MEQISGCDVLAKHMHVVTPLESTLGVVLCWDSHKREYIVWTLDYTGAPGQGHYGYDMNRAMRVYLTRIADLMSSTHNTLRIELLKD